ncbi:hypothetical protein CYMTET_18527 [Cymbomonas tetramitiformis]|uniref:Uncharacterized protein n=1 Tax=Cymbomonas tetramitiformis TaxID=36881 RepID=A0AAE0G844_9CHLO|nr:hypothetical protein CYMTET_18527 [Cymbomonas tetramitiformis]
MKKQRLCKGYVKYEPSKDVGALSSHADPHKQFLSQVQEKLNTSGQAPTQPAGSRQSKAVHARALTTHFKGVEKYSAKHPKQLLFEDDLCLLVGKSLKPISIVEDVWFR